MTEEQNAVLEEACAELVNIISDNQSFLNQLQEEIDQTKAPPAAATLKQIGNGDHVAALEARNRDLAFLRTGPRATDCKPSAILSNQPLLVSLARAWLSHTRTEMQYVLVEEKLRGVSLKKEIKMKMIILNENKMLFNALLEKKKALEELAASELQMLTKQKADLEEICEAMKIILNKILAEYFPGPEIPGYTSMNTLMMNLIKPLRIRRRSTYIRVKDSVWPYYLEILETYGIIEHHPVDKAKIRLVDFSDGHLGLDPKEMEAIKEKEENKKRAKAKKRERERKNNSENEITEENALERILRPRRIVSKGQIVSNKTTEKSTKYWTKGDEDTQEDDWEESD